jgi:hypothetical protein
MGRGRGLLDCQQGKIALGAQVELACVLGEGPAGDLLRVAARVDAPAAL